MIKRLLIIMAIVCSTSSFSQLHSYVFKIVGVTDPAQAKQTIDEMRAILKIKIFYFDDTTDEFRMVNERYPLNMEEIQEDLNANGIYLDGGYEYFVSE